MNKVVFLLALLAGCAETEPERTPVGYPPTAENLPQRSARYNEGLSKVLELAWDGPVARVVETTFESGYLAGQDDGWDYAVHMRRALAVLVCAEIVNVVAGDLPERSKYAAHCARWNEADGYKPENRVAYANERLRLLRQLTATSDGKALSFDLQKLAVTSFDGGYLAGSKDYEDKASLGRAFDVKGAPNLVEVCRLAIDSVKGLNSALVLHPDKCPTLVDTEFAESTTNVPVAK
jgi:hypothetical protein